VNRRPSPNGIYLDREVFRLDSGFGPAVRRRRRQPTLWEWLILTVRHVLRRLRP
jgi:hypothetical protein